MTAVLRAEAGLGPEREEAGGVVYRFGSGAASFLYPTSNAGTARSSQAFWLVDDIDGEMAELRGRGVKCEEYDTSDMKTENGIFTGGGARAAWFKDTEGNIMAIVQSL